MGFSFVERVGLKQLMIAGSLVLILFGFLSRAGAQEAAIQPRIVGGDPAPDDAWPSTVQVFVKIAPGEYNFCGGTLIDKGWVLTAGHCVVDENDKPRSYAAFQVLIGTQLLSSSEGELVDVTNVYLHPGFYTDGFGVPRNDIALLELSIDSDVETLPLVSSSPAVGTMATVVGWGLTDPDMKDLSETLREVDLPIVSNSTCNTVYNGLISDSEMCAGYVNGGKDACLGDSGGPLMVEQGGIYRQAGIVSVGAGCAETYGVYTRVSAYLAWISQYVSTTPDPDPDPDGGSGDGGGGAMGPWWLVILLGISTFVAVRGRRMGD